MTPDEHLACLIPQAGWFNRLPTWTGRTLVADLNAKSVRKAIATIRANGPEACAVVLQGKLQPDNTPAEAGLTIQLKASRNLSANNEGSNNEAVH